MKCLQAVSHFFALFDAADDKFVRFPSLTSLKKTIVTYFLLSCSIY